MAHRARWCGTMIDVDISQVLHDNLPYNVFKLYDVFRTTCADKQLEKLVA